MAGTSFDITLQRQAEQALLDSQRELSELAQRLLVQERETARRLAQALHDSIGQLLGSCRLHLDLASTAAPGDTAVARAAALLERAVAEVRRLLVDLRPPLLDTQGLWSPASTTSCAARRPGWQCAPGCMSATAPAAASGPPTSPMPRS